jgi:arylformamidase
MTVFDLSHTVSADTPVYPGDPAVQVDPAGTFAKDGFCDHKLTFGSHAGTHVDAPAHMIKGGKQLKDYEIERFIRHAVCVDATNGFDAAAIARADIQPGDAVLFYTGISEHFMEDIYWSDYSVLDEACCQLLIDKQVSMVGLDTASADNVDGFPVHKKLLGADILIVENLTNLKDLVGSSFEFTALPLKLEKDGAPVRAVARIGE